MSMISVPLFPLLSSLGLRSFLTPLPSLRFCLFSTSSPFLQFHYLPVISSRWLPWQLIRLVQVTHVFAIETCLSYLLERLRNFTSFRYSWMTSSIPHCFAKTPGSFKSLLPRFIIATFFPRSCVDAFLQCLCFFFKYLASWSFDLRVIASAFSSHFPCSAVK